jgi:hypothetical protein
MCLVLAWKIGLTARNIAPRLSHHMTGRELHLIPNSESKELIQRSSVVAMAKLLYSASVDDLEIVACFLED